MQLVEGLENMNPLSKQQMLKQNPKILKFAFEHVLIAAEVAGGFEL